MRWMAGAALAVGLGCGWSSTLRASTTAEFVYTGTVQSGIDSLGYFGPIGADLTGDGFVFSNYIQDDQSTGGFLTIAGSNFSFDTGGVLLTNPTHNVTITSAGKIYGNMSALELAVSSYIGGAIGQNVQFGKYGAGFGTFTIYSDPDFGMSVEQLSIPYQTLIVEPVPLPATLPLLATGLLALGALAYRKRLTGAP